MTNPVYAPKPTGLHVRRILLVLGGGGGLLLLLGMGVLWFQGEPVAMVAQDTPALHAAPKVTAYAPDPKPPDPSPVDQTAPLRADLARMMGEMARLNAELSALKTRPAPVAAAAPAAPTEKPKVLKHQPMMFKQFAQPQDTVSDDPLYGLAPGTFLPCHIVTAVNSETGSTFVAETTSPVYASARQHHQKVLIPQGSTILGEYNGGSLVHGSDRLPTVALSLVIDGGEPIDLGPSPITDEVGQNGLMSRIDHHWWRLAKAVLIGGALRGGAQAAQVATAGGGVAAQVGASMAQSGNQAVQRQTNWAIDVRPTIWVDPGAPCTVILLRPLALQARAF